VPPVERTRTALVVHAEVLSWAESRDISLELNREEPHTLISCIKDDMKVCTHRCMI
jgi:hypothetical protein